MKPNEQNELRTKYLDEISDFLKSKGEDVLRVASNELAFPCVSSGGEEGFMVLTFKIPKGTRDGEEYDGYAEADSYAKESAAKAEKKKAIAEKKKKKIASDTAKRKAKAEAENKIDT